MLTNTSVDQPTPFWYQSDPSPYSTPVTTRFSTYPPGGYTAPLGRAAPQALALLTHLRSHSWLDTHTAAIMAETTLYNANTNLLSVVRVVIEVPPSSGLYPQVHVHTFRPYPYVDAWDFVFLLVQVVWLCYVLFLVVRTGMKVRKQGWTFVRHTWNVIDCVLVTLSLLAMTFFVLRSVTIVRCVEEIMNNKGE